jgi:hypothetical protein
MFWPFDLPFTPTLPDWWIAGQLPSTTYPMPICGCTGPCLNSDCPHRPKATCENMKLGATYGMLGR